MMEGHSRFSRPDTVLKKASTKSLIPAMIGNALEWYEFALCGYFAKVIGALFFPHTESQTGSGEIQSMLLGFGVYLSGFVMRPLGGLFFGYIGDRYGSEKAFLWSIILMAVPTTCIGLLPTFDTLGLWAPVLLTLLRLCQGFSMGGEFTGSMIYMIERAPQGSRGFFGSFASLSVLLGMIGGALMTAFLNAYFSPQALMAYAWRVPFILSILGNFLVLVMRAKAHQPSKNPTSPRSPLASLFSHHKKTIGIILLIDMTVAVGFFMTTTFVVSFLQTWGKVPAQVGFWLNVFGMSVFAAVIPLGGKLSDKIGRRPLMQGAALGFLALSCPIFYYLTSPLVWQVTAAHSLLCALMGAFFATISCVLVESFPKSVRYSGISLVHNTAMAIFGGTCPWLCTWLIQKTQWVLVPGLYLCLSGGISLVGLYFFKDRYQASRDAIDNL